MPTGNEGVLSRARASEELANYTRDPTNYPLDVDTGEGKFKIEIGDAFAVTPSATGRPSFHRRKHPDSPKTIVCPGYR